MGYVKNEMWILEPGDTISIHQLSGSVNVRLESYTVTSVDGAVLSLPENPNLCGHPIKPMHELEEYIGRDVMVEDWTRRHTNRINGYVGVLSKNGDGLVVKSRELPIEATEEITKDERPEILS